ncbi:hypothetical protein Pmani_022655 [Petrolisthes manimaculis]|uniref:Uncharacterized protein n=1 Tax=Petrolisthes manimaculis TaxID=1843537 RepID=A0AAE1U0Y0_9EUCA|nr:hypothetical protein Pmani_022655 [Petrolisthes manimaculis]
MVKWKCVVVLMERTLGDERVTTAPWEIRASLYILLGVSGKWQYFVTASLLTRTLGNWQSHLLRPKYTTKAFTTFLYLLPPSTSSTSFPHQLPPPPFPINFIHLLPHQLPPPPFPINFLHLLPPSTSSTSFPHQFPPPPFPINFLHLLSPSISSTSSFGSRPCHKTLSTALS